MGLIKDLLYSNKIGLMTSKALDVHAKRALLITGNIANAETPGYKARDIKPFEDELKKAYHSKSIDMAKTSSKHIDGGGGSLKNFKTEIAISQNAGRPDGNNVNLEEETVNMKMNSTMYEAIIRAKGKRGKMISSTVEQR